MVHILNWYICALVLLFHIDSEGKCGWIIVGGRLCWPPPELLGGGAVPLTTPMQTPQNGAQKSVNTVCLQKFKLKNQQE